MLDSANTSIEQIETGSFVEHTSAAELQRELRIVSWNVARGCCFDAIADFLQSINADLILLQEVDKNSRRTGYRNIAKELAEKLRMNYAFGAEFNELAHGSFTSPALHGQATLSRWKLSHARVLRFREQSSFWCPYWWIPKSAIFQRRLGGRMALVTNVSVGRKNLVVYNLHLESRNGNDLRLRQLRELLDDTFQYELEWPVVAGGDFNFDVSHKHSGAYIAGAGFENTFGIEHLPTTVPNWIGRQRSIDCVLSRGAWDASIPEVHTWVKASDHYPLTLTLRG